MSANRRTPSQFCKHIGKVEVFVSFSACTPIDSIQPETDEFEKKNNLYESSWGRWEGGEGEGELQEREQRNGEKNTKKNINTRTEPFISAIPQESAANNQSERGVNAEQQHF